MIIGHEMFFHKVWLVQDLQREVTTQGALIAPVDTKGNSKLPGGEESYACNGTSDGFEFHTQQDQLMAQCSPSCL